MSSSIPTGKIAFYLAIKKPILSKAQLNQAVLLYLLALLPPAIMRTSYLFLKFT